MYDTYIREMIDAIKTADGVSVEPDNRLYDVLSRMWSNYAVAIFDVNDVKEAAEMNDYPMSLSEAREILFQIEEGQQGGIDKAAIDSAVEDWFEKFDWFGKESDPINPTEFNLKTCNWAVVTHTLTDGAGTLKSMQKAQLVSHKASLSDVVEMIKSLDPDPALAYGIYVGHDWKAENELKLDIQQIADYGKLIWRSDLSLKK